MPTKIERNIERLPSGKFRVRASYEGRQFSIGTYWTLGDARAALDITRGEIARGTFVPPAERRQEAKARAQDQAQRATTVREWSVTWLAGLEELGRSPGTITSYSSTLNVHVLPVIGDRRLADVHRDEIDELVKDVRARKAPWANVARTVRAMYRAALAAEAGGLTESPVRLEVPKAARARTLADDEIPTAVQVRALREAMPPELAVAVDLAASCALRLGEVLGLQRRDLERLDTPDRSVLHVRRQWLTKAHPPTYAEPKRGSARTVSIPPSLVARLLEHVETYAGPGRLGPVLPSPRDTSRPISEQAFNRYWTAAKTKVGVEFRYHDLRHYGLSLYARQGATLTEIMRRGGHTDVEAALRYQHAGAERDRALTALLDADLDDDTPKTRTPSRTKES